MPEPKSSVHVNLLRDDGESSPSGGRRHHHRFRSGGAMKDPFTKYEVVEVLGHGSMGTVSRVRLLPEALQGSASSKPKKVRGVFRFGNLVSKKRQPKEAQQQQQEQQQPLEAPSPSSSSSSLASSSPSPHYYALKSIELERISQEAFLKELRNEIDIIRSLDHPNIVKAHEVYENRGQIFLVLELLDGGDLFSRSPYSEQKACRYVTQILSAVRYMHARGVIHRDLKLENICFENQHPDAEVKIIDFGLSKKFISGRPGMMTDRVGTVYTMSPEVLDGMYTSKADLWSVGVITYMLLSSTRPFQSKKRSELVTMIMDGLYRPMDSPVWEQISKAAKDFVTKLLALDPKDRMSAEQALEHTWIQSGKESLLSSQNPIENVPNDQFSKSDRDAMKAFRDYGTTSKLKKLGLMVIAHRSSRQDIFELREEFERYDTNRDGVLSMSEFKAAMKKTGNYSDKDIHEIFANIDINQNGHIMYTEFLAATIEAHGYIEESRIAEAFDRLADGSPYITREDMEKMVGEELSRQEFRDMIASMDTDGDGKISYDEFLAAFRKQQAAVISEIASTGERKES